MCVNITLILAKNDVVTMSLFDKDLALEQAGGSSELAKELFEMLIKDLPSSLNIIQQAHANLDKEAVWDAVHKIHGGTAYCGVPELKLACKEMEDEIKISYPSTKIDSLLNKLEVAINILLTESESLIETL